jgi:hypothetical protein
MVSRWLCYVQVDFHPAFIWLLRDFQLLLKEGRKTLTPSEYLEETLNSISGTETDVANRNQVGTCGLTSSSDRGRSICGTCCIGMQNITPSAASSVAPSSWALERSAELASFRISSITKVHEAVGALLCLLLTDGHNSSEQMRGTIKAVFPDRDAWTLVRPAMEEFKLQQLDVLPANELRPEFRQVRMTLFCRSLVLLHCLTSFRALSLSEGL